MGYYILICTQSMDLNRCLFWLPFFTWSLYFTDLLILYSVILALIWPYYGLTQILVTHHLLKSSLVSK